LIDFGIGRAKTWTQAKSHGAILVGPDGDWTEEILGEVGASRRQVCALLGELCAKLPGNLPRQGAFGEANLGEYAIRSLATLVLPGNPAPLIVKAPVKGSLLAGTVASPYFIALATAALILLALQGMGGLLARHKVNAGAVKLLIPSVTATDLDAQAEGSPDISPQPAKAAELPAPKKQSARKPVSSIILARGARPIRQTSLEYPAEAKKGHVSGMVEMQLTIAEDGSVQSPRVLSGDPLLRAGLVEEISKWVYQPLRVNGKPVPMTTELAIRFNLNP
jgi:TonB family protein